MRIIQLSVTRPVPLPWLFFLSCYFFFFPFLFVIFVFVFLLLLYLSLAVEVCIQFPFIISAAFNLCYLSGGKTQLLFVIIIFLFQVIYSNCFSFMIPIQIWSFLLHSHNSSASFIPCSFSPILFLKLLVILSF